MCCTHKTCWGTAEPGDHGNETTNDLDSVPGTETEPSHAVFLKACLLISLCVTMSMDGTAVDLEVCPENEALLTLSIYDLWCCRRMAAAMTQMKWGQSRAWTVAAVPNPRPHREVPPLLETLQVLVQLQLARGHPSQFLLLTRKSYWKVPPCVRVWGYSCMPMSQFHAVTIVLNVKTARTDLICNNFTICELQVCIECRISTHLMHHVSLSMHST